MSDDRIREKRSSDERDEAIEAIAYELHDATNSGVLFDRWFFRVPYEVAQRHARELFDRLGLVVVDSALVTAAQTASERAYCDGRCDEMGCRGHEGSDDDFRPWSDRERAKQALADAVLEQLKGPTDAP